jgi:serine palmitoyltransferase
LNGIYQVINKVFDNYITVEGLTTPVLNLSSFDFLGMSRDLDIKKTAKGALDFYGCGSCGPRGFYGTIDQHLFFEESIAKFMGTQVILLAFYFSSLKFVIFASGGNLLFRWCHCRFFCDSSVL